MFLFHPLVLKTWSVFLDSVEMVSSTLFIITIRGNIVTYICDSTWENDPYRAKSTFSVEVKISHAVIHCKVHFILA